MRYLCVVFSALFICSSALAQEVTPEATPAASSGLPEITIVRREGGSIEEYRLGERIFMVKLSPAKGEAYFLVDTDGDGKLNTRYNATGDAGLVIPSWVVQ